MTASSKTNNILIIRLSAIGDIFHAFTVLSDIKSQMPGAVVDWLVDENFAEVARLSPLIDNLIIIPMQSWKSLPKLKILSNLFQWQQQLERQVGVKHYDYIIDLQGLFKTGVITRFFTGMVCGLDCKSAKEGLLASIFYTRRFSVNRNQVAIKRFRSLAGQALTLNYKSQFDFKIRDQQPAAAVKIQGHYILLVHGTSKSKKEWSLENWCALTIELLQRYPDYKICISYSCDKQRQFVNAMAARIEQVIGPGDNTYLKNFIIIPTLAIAEFAHLVRNSALTIGVDTGFTHLANLLHRPVIMIHLTPNQHYGGVLSDKISFNLVCNNSPREHWLVLAIIRQHMLD